MNVLKHHPYYSTNPYRPMMNKRLSKHAVLGEYAVEMERMRKGRLMFWIFLVLYDGVNPESELALARAKEGVYISEEEYHRLNLNLEGQSSELHDMKELVEQRELELETRVEEVRTLESVVLNIKAQLVDKDKQLALYQASLKENNHLLELANAKTQDLEADLEQVEECLEGVQASLRDTQASLHQKETLILAHIEREKKLNAAVGNLNANLVDARSDMATMHVKVEGACQTNSRNLVLSQSHKQVVHSGLNRLNAMVEELSSDQVQGLVALTSQVQSMALKEAEQADQHLVHLEELLDFTLPQVLQASSQGIQTLVASHSSSMDQASLVLQEAHHKHGILLEGWTSHVKQTLASTQEVLEATHSRWAQVVASLQQEAARSAQSHSQLHADHSTLSSLTRQAVEACVAALEQEARSLETHIQASAQADKARQAEQKSRVVKTMLSMLDDLEKEGSQFRAHILDSVATHAAKTEYVARDQRKQVLDQVDKHVQSTGHWVDQESKVRGQQSDWLQGCLVQEASNKASEKQQVDLALDVVMGMSTGVEQHEEEVRTQMDTVLRATKNECGRVFEVYRQ